MMLEFKVLYRVAGHDSTIPGPLLEQTVQRETRNEVTAIFESLKDVVWFDVGKGRPVIDWTQTNFSRSEAAVYMRKSEAWIDEQAGKGLLPRARNGHPVYAREALDRLRAKIMEGDPLREAA